MDRAHARTKRTLRVQRAFERSRLEEHLIAAAYELAVPPLRRARPAVQRSATNGSPPSQPLPLAGGFFS